MMARILSADETKKETRRKGEEEKQEIGMGVVE